MENKRKRDEFIKGINEVKSESNELDQSIVNDPKWKEQAKKREERRKQRNRRLLGAGIIGTAAAIGIGAGTIGKNNNQDTVMPTKQPAIEQEDGNSKKKIKPQNEKYVKIKQEDRNYVEIEQESNEIKQAVEALENKEDVLRFLKNEYIEECEKVTGDTSLTTEDIKICESYQDYVYANNRGELITHGENPYQTVEMLEKEGMSYEEKYDVIVYEVHKGDEIIDCMALLRTIQLENNINKTTPVQVIIGGSEYKPYDSVLTRMGEVISKGMNYWDNIEKDEISKEMAKREFIEALEEKQERTSENLVVKKDEGYEIGD